MLLSLISEDSLCLSEMKSLLTFSIYPSASVIAKCFVKSLLY